MSVNQEFIVGGKPIHLTYNQVVSALKDVEPGPIKIHAVEVNGLRYPIKQAFSCVTGLDVLDFTTNQARSILGRLGFKVVRV